MAPSASQDRPCLPGFLIQGKPVLIHNEFYMPFLNGETICICKCLTQGGFAERQFTALYLFAP